ncbi:glycosyltransferase family 1 protein [Patescibacteria group bacterium]|nr:MAG: glycosyltransferase family 1 protein [Patescibacteria group bacterium]
MRIGIDGRCLQDNPRTGVGEAAFHLIKNLARIDRSSEIFVLLNTYGDIGIDFSEPNIKIIKKSVPNKLLNASLKFFKKPFLDSFFDKIDLFFAPNWNFISLSPDLPFVLTVHDLSIFLYPEFYSPYSRFWHKRLLSIKRLIERADHIIVPSSTTKNDLEKLFPISRGKAAVIPWGADHIKQTQNSKLKTQNFGNKFILFLATVEERKNVRGLIAAYEYARVKKMISDDIDLILAGSKGYGFSAIKKMADKSKFASQIKILGPVSDEQKKDLYSSAAAFAYPSFYEGFGFPPMEAMAFGVPVIASSSASLGEILGNAALLIQPYQTAELAAVISNVLNDENLRKKYTQRGAELVKKYQWKDAAEKLSFVFKSAFKGAS